MRVESGEVAVSLTETEDELRSLAAWLRDEDTLRGRVRLAERPIEQGHMGATLDAVVTVVSSGTTSAFVSSLFSWLSHKRETRKVSLKVRAENGREIEISCGSSDEVQPIIERIRSFLNDDM